MGARAQAGLDLIADASQWTPVVRQFQADVAQISQSLLNLERSTGSINNTLNMLAAGMRTAATSTGQATTGFQSLTDAMQQGIGISLGMTAANAFTQMGQAAMSFLGDAMEIVKYYQLLDFSITSMIAVQGKLQNDQADMNTLLAQGAQEADKYMLVLQDLAIYSPFTTQTLADGFKLLQVYSFAAKDAAIVTDIITDFGSAAGLTNDVMHRLFLAIGQVKSEGRLLAREVLQMSQAGIPVRDILAKNMEVTQEKLSDMMRDGAIPAGKAIKLILEYLNNFEGSGKRAASTLTGLTTSLQDIKEISTRDLFSKMFEPLQPLLQQMVDFGASYQFRASMTALGEEIGRNVAAGLQFTVNSFARIGEAFNSLGPSVTNAMAIFFSFGAAVTATVGTVGVLALAINTLINPFTIIVGALSAMATAWLTDWNGIRTTTADVLDDISSGLETLGSDVIDWGTNIVASLANGIAGATSLITDALSSIASVMTFWLEPGSPPKLLPDLTFWGKGAAQAWLAGWQLADYDALKSVTDAVSSLLNANAAIKGKNQKDAIPAQLVNLRPLIAQAIEEQKRFGAVSAETWRGVGAVVGTYGDEIRQLITLEIQTAAATNVQADAQRRLNEITSRYTKMLEPLQQQLDEINNTYNKADVEVQVRALQRAIQGGGLSETRTQKAQAEIQKLLTQQKIDDLQLQQNKEQTVAQKALDAATEIASVAQQQLDLYKARYDAETKQLDLIGQENKNILNRERARTDEHKKQLTALELQAKAIKLQQDELKDVIAAAKANYILNDATATAAEKAAAQLTLQEIATNKLTRREEARKLGLDSIIAKMDSLWSINVTLHDMGIKVKETNAALDNMTESLADLASIDVDGPLKRFNEELAKARTNISSTSKAFNAWIDSIDAVLPSFLKIRPAAYWMGKAINEGSIPYERLRDTMAAMNTTAANVIPFLDTMRAAIVGISTAFLSSRLLTVLAQLPKAFTTLGGALNIAALALGAFAVIWQLNVGDIQGKTGQLVAYMNEQFGKLPGMLQPYWDQLVANLTAFALRAQTAWQQFADITGISALAPQLQTLVQNIQQIFKMLPFVDTLPSLFWSNVDAFKSNLVNFIASIWMTLENAAVVIGRIFIDEWLPQFDSWITGLWGRVAPDLQRYGQQILVWIVNTASTIAQVALLYLVPSLIGFVVVVASEILPRLAAVAQTLLGWIVQTGATIADKVRNEWLPAFTSWVQGGGILYALNMFYAMILLTIAQFKPKLAEQILSIVPVPTVMYDRFMEFLQGGIIKAISDLYRSLLGIIAQFNPQLSARLAEIVPAPDVALAHVRLFINRVVGELAGMWRQLTGQFTLGQQGLQKTWDQLTFDFPFLNIFENFGTKLIVIVALVRTSAQVFRNFGASLSQGFAALTGLNWQTVVTSMSKVTTAVKALFASFGGGAGIRGTLTVIFTELLAAIRGFAVNAGPQLVFNLVNGFTTALRTLGTAIVRAVPIVQDALLMLVNSSFSQMAGAAVRNIITAAKLIVGSFRNGLVAGFATIGESLVAIFSDIGLRLPTVFDDILVVVGDALNLLVHSLPNALRGAGTLMIQSGQSIVSGLSLLFDRGMTAIVTTVTAKIRPAFNFVIGVLSNANNAFRVLGVTLLWLMEHIANIGSGIISAARGFTSFSALAAKAVQGIASALMSFGANLAVIDPSDLVAIFSRFFNLLRGGFSGVVQMVANFRSSFSGILGIIGNITKVFATMFAGAGKGGLSIFGTIFKTLAKGFSIIKPLASGIGLFLKNLLAPANLLGFAFGFLIDQVIKYWGTISQFAAQFGALFGKLTAVFNFETIGKAWQAMLALFGGNEKEKADATAFFSYLWAYLQGWLALVSNWFMTKVLPAFTAWAVNLPYELGDYIVRTFQSILDFLSTVGGLIATYVMPWVGAFTSWLVAAWPAIAGYLNEILSSFWQWIVDTSVWLWTQTTTVWIPAFTAWVQEVWPGVWAGLVSFTTYLIGWIREASANILNVFVTQWVPAFVNWVVTAGPPLLAQLGQWLLQLGGWILSTGVPTLLTWVLEFATTMVTWVGMAAGWLLPKLGEWLGALVGWIISTGIPSLAGAVVNLAKVLWGWISGNDQYAAGDSAWGKVGEALMKFLGKVGEIILTVIIPGIFQLFVNVAKGALDGLMTLFSPENMTSLGQKALELGGSIVGGVQQAFSDGLANTQKGATDFFGGIFDAGKDFLEAHSPSAKAARELGEPIMQGIAQGLTSTDISMIVNGVAEKILAMFDTIAADVPARVGDMTAGVTDQIGILQTSIALLFATIVQTTHMQLETLKTNTAQQFGELDLGVQNQTNAMAAFLMRAWIDLTSTVTMTATTLKSNVVTQMQQLRDGAIKAAQETASGVVAALGDGENGLVKQLTDDWVPKGYDLGSDFANGIADGIWDQIDAIAAAAAQAVTDAIAAARAAAQAQSPSRRTANEIGKPFAQGIAVGIEQNASSVAAAAASALNSAIGAVQADYRPGTTSTQTVTHNVTYVNNYNLNLGTSRDASSLRQEFAMMEILAL